MSNIQKFPENADEIFQLQSNLSNKTLKDNRNLKQEDLILVGMYEYYIQKNNQNNSKILLTWGAGPCLIIGFKEKNNQISGLLHLPILESEIRMNNGDRFNGSEFYNASIKKIYDLTVSKLNNESKLDLEFHFHGCKNKNVFNSILKIIQNQFSEKFNLNLGSYDLNFDQNEDLKNSEKDCKSLSINSQTGEIHFQISDQIIDKIFDKKDLKSYCDDAFKKNDKKIEQIVEQKNFDVLEEAKGPKDLPKSYIELIAKTLLFCKENNIL